MILCDIQHTIRHQTPDCFELGEKVFLKSNPEIEMQVESINEFSVTTSWKLENNELETSEFPPQCLLQYKYACFVTYFESYDICLN